MEETFNLVTNLSHESSASKRKNKLKITKKVTFAQTIADNAHEINSNERKRPRFDKGSNNGASDEGHEDVVAKQRRLSERLHSKELQPSNGDDNLGAHFEQRGSTIISSSIFTKNPQIPKMKITTNKEMNEAVFATKSFSDMQIHPYLVSNLRQSFSIERLTVIQELSIPVILTGKDALIKSQTGSGKTLAYAVPIVQILQGIEPRVKRDDGIYGVIVVPTRELAVQTFECFHTLLKSFNRLVVTCFMGGQKRKSEKASLRRGVNLLVTTPQRFLDHLQNSQQLDISRVRWLVLDEADRLTDMGYERDVACIVKALKHEVAEEGKGNTVQVIMVSATLSEGVDRLAGLSLASPIVIDCAIETNATEKPHQLVTPTNLKQYFLVTPVKLRLVTLASFVLWKCRGDRHKLLVFLPTQDMVDFHAKLFNHIVDDGQSANDDDESILYNNMESTVTISQLHGNMTQHERTEVFKTFRAAKCGVLLCTDVASRGLDLPQVHWIVQYSAPTSAADYVHRVGRTARIGTEGSALLFLLPSETAYVQHLDENNILVHQMTVESILDALPRVQIGRLNKKTKGAPQAVLHSAEEAATSLQLTCERAVKNDVALTTAARKAFQSFVRFYSTYPATLRTIFPFKELHLGHVAKSMALLETPTVLGSFRKSSSSSSSHRSLTDRQQHGNNRHQQWSNSDHQRATKVVVHNPMQLMLMEYGSGL